MISERVCDIGVLGVGFRVRGCNCDKRGCLGWVGVEGGVGRAERVTGAVGLYCVGP